jgi:ubiquinone/menaquinone biosynthesis C-methylase UbiE
MVPTLGCFYHGSPRPTPPSQNAGETTTTTQLTQVSSSSPNQSSTLPLDLEALKARQRVMWGSGDFSIIGTTLQLVGEQLCEAADVAAGSRVLDVACGNGNATLAAARRFCEVTGVDYVPSLLARGRDRAAAERLPIRFVEGDAEALPFEEGVFDTVLSTFGVMFAANQARAASEMVRVCKRGGTIAVASWTPEGFLGDMLRTISAYVPPPPSSPSPLLWGTERGISELFGTRTRTIALNRKEFVFRYRTPEHFVQIFRDYYGPTFTAFRGLSPEKASQLQTDLLNLLARSHRKGSLALAVPGQYLEVVLEKK